MRTVYISEANHEAIKAISKATGAKMQSLADIAIAQYVKAENKKRSRSSQ